MGLVQPALLLLAWDGYQCGTCGAEFKTQAELRSHQMSQHSTPSTNTQDTAVGWGECSDQQYFVFVVKVWSCFQNDLASEGFNDSFLRRIESWWSSVWQDASNRRHGKIDKPLQDTNIGSGKTLTCHPSTSPNLHCGQTRWLWVAKILDQESVRVKSLPYIGNLSYFQISWEVQRPIFDIRVINSRNFFANWT